MSRTHTAHVAAYRTQLVSTCSSFYCYFCGYFSTCKTNRDSFTYGKAIAISVYIRKYGIISTTPFSCTVLFTVVGRIVVTS